MRKLLTYLEAAASQREPSVRLRLVVALTLGIIAAMITFGQYAGKPGFHTDFGMLWYGARAVAHGVNPYPLIGPGRVFNYAWPLIYPLPAVVSVMPLAFFTEEIAATLFVFLSTVLLAFGLTRDGWYRLPLFTSEAFLSAAKLGQWSIFLTAGLFLPWIGFFAIAKPQSSIPVFAGSTSRRALVFAMAGCVALLTISLILQPHWIPVWFDGVRNARHMEPPITRFGGLLILLVLIKWRRPESWLVLSLACLPQSWGWYGTLPLFTVPSSFVQAVFLAGVAAIGGNIAAIVMPASVSQDGFFYWAGSVLVITIYLPVVILILRRPNVGPEAAWMKAIQRVKRNRNQG